VTSQNAGQRVAPQGIHAILRFLVGSHYVGAVEQAVQEKWTEFYAPPGSHAHSLFVDGEIPEGEPVFKEFVLGFGSERRDLAFDGGLGAHFYVALTGCRYVAPRSEFLERLKDILYIKPQVSRRPYQDGILHQSHDESVQPKKRLKRDNNKGRTGVKVEDL
jgi:hypothetical protein